MNTKTIFPVAFIAATASLAFALSVQYGFGLVPCELCIMERVPYGLVMVVAVAGIISRKNTILSYIVIALFLAGSGIAAYHSLVEKHLIKGPDTCTSENAQNLSIDDMLKKIKSAPVVACDQPQWEFHGITLALLNALWSFALACGMGFLLRKEKNAKATGG